MKKNVFGNELYEQLKEQRSELENWKFDSIARDGEYNDSYYRERECELERKMRILKEDNGLADFDAVIDENGDEVWVKWVNTRFGGAWVGRGIFASSKKALLKKTGWHIEEIKVPIWINKHGEYARWHTNMATGEYVGYPS